MSHFRKITVNLSMWVSFILWLYRTDMSQRWFHFYKFCWEFQYIILLHLISHFKRRQSNGGTRDFQNAHVSLLKTEDSGLWNDAKISFGKYSIGTLRHFACPQLWAFWLQCSWGLPFFWDVTLRCCVIGSWRFEATWCPYLHGWV